MTDKEKEKLHRVLSSLWKNDESVGKTYYNQALQDVQTAIDLQEEPVSEDLEEAIEDAMPDANWYIEENNDTTGEDAYNSIQMGNMFKAGAQWRKEKMMANAVDVTIAMPYQNGYGGYTQLLDSKEALPFGDNLKVLVIKED